MTEDANKEEKKTVPEDSTEAYKKVVELLNDPKEVAAAAARLGMKLAPTQEPAKKEDEIVEPETVELPENATPADMVAAFNQALKNQKEYLSKVHKRELDTVKKEQMERERTKQAQTIQQFAQKAKHFKELYNDIEAFYNTGKNTIEEAYKKALKLNDKDDPEMGITFNKPKTTTLEQDNLLRITSPKLSDEASTDEDKKPKFTNTADAVKANLRDIIANDPKAADVLNEENA